MSGERTTLSSRSLWCCSTNERRVLENFDGDDAPTISLTLWLPMYSKGMHAVGSAAANWRWPRGGFPFLDPMASLTKLTMSPCTKAPSMTSCSISHLTLTASRSSRKSFDALEWYIFGTLSTIASSVLSTLKLLECEFAIVSSYFLLLASLK